MEILRKGLLVERDFQLFGEAVGVERAHRKISPFDFDGGNLALAIIDAQYRRFGFRVVINVDLTKSDSSVLEEALRATAVATPCIRIDGNFSHYIPFVISNTIIRCGVKPPDSVCGRPNSSMGTRL